MDAPYVYRWNGILSSMNLTETERVIVWLALEGVCGIWEAAWDLSSQGLVAEDAAVPQAMADTKTLLRLGLIELYSQQEVTDEATAVDPADAYEILDNVVNWTPPGEDDTRPMYLLGPSDSAADSIGVVDPLEP